MRKLFRVLLIVTSLACSKEDNPDLNSFSIEASVEHQGNIYPINQEFTVYYFERIDVTNGYSLQPDVILIDDQTGNLISYTEKFKVNNDNGIVVFKNLPKDLHSVIVDVSNTFRQDIDIDSIVAKAFNMDNQPASKGLKNGIHFVSLLEKITA